MLISPIFWSPPFSEWNEFCTFIDPYSGGGARWLGEGNRSLLPKVTTVFLFSPSAHFLFLSHFSYLFLPIIFTQPSSFPQSSFCFFQPSPLSVCLFFLNMLIIWIYQEWRMETFQTRIRNGEFFFSLHPIGRSSHQARNKTFLISFQQQTLLRW